MTAGHDALLRLQDDHAFDPVPPRVGLHGFHVPFDELTGTRVTEAELTRAIRAVERVAVAGRSGVGKTSMAQHVLALMADEVAAIRVPVDAEDDQTVTSPAGFMSHVVRTVVRHLDSAERLTDEERTVLLAGTAATRSVSSRRVRQTTLGIAPWMLKGEVAREVETAATANIGTSAADHIAHARVVVDTVVAHRLIPVLVVDDSDAWLNTAAADRTPLIGPFFGRVLRTVADELPVALVVAVNERYYAVEDFPRGGGALESTITIPALPGPDALASILDARTQFAETSVFDVMADDAIAALHTGYEQADGNIRKAMLLAHTALHVACDDDADKITMRHVEVAMTQYPTVPG